MIDRFYIPLVVPRPVAENWYTLVNPTKAIDLSDFLLKKKTLGAIHQIDKLLAALASVKLLQPGSLLTHQIICLLSYISSYVKLNGDSTGS